MCDDSPESLPKNGEFFKESISFPDYYGFGLHNNVFSLIKNEYTQEKQKYFGYFFRCFSMHSQKYRCILNKKSGYTL